MKINKFLALLLILAIPVSLSACGKSADFTTNDDKSSHWYNMECGCGKFVPEPQKEYKLLQYSDFLSAEVPNVSEKEFEEYVKSCIDNGFTGMIASANSPTKYFDSTNTQGYILKVYFYAEEGYFSVYSSPPEK